MFVHAGGSDWSAAWLSSDAKSQGQQSLLPWMAVLQCPHAALPSGGLHLAALNAPSQESGALQGPPSMRGQPIVAMGSPFGALSHAHFGNHIASGVIANIVHAEVGVNHRSCIIFRCAVHLSYPNVFYIHRGNCGNM